MSDKELNETLMQIARVPGEFRRDTPMLFNALDRLEAINKELQQAIDGKIQHENQS